MGYKYMVKHVTVQIPKKLADLIDLLVENGYQGYRTRAEFVTTSIRRQLDIIKELDGLPK